VLFATLWKSNSLDNMHSVELDELKPICASGMCKPYTSIKESMFSVSLDHLMYLYKRL